MRRASMIKTNCTILLAFTCMLLLPSVSSDGSFCNQVFNFDAYFSLLALKVDNYYTQTLTSAQGNFSYPLTETPTALAADYTSQLLYYNFCQTVKLKTADTCATEANANAAYALTFAINPETKAVSDCATMNKLTTNSKFEDYEYALIDGDKPQIGIVYSIHRMDQTIDQETQKISTFNKTITYVMYCDSTATFTYQGWKYFKNATNENYYIQAVTKYGCPTLQLSKLWQVLSDSEVLFTIVMLALGGVLCFFGLKIYKPTLFIIGYLTGFAGIVVVMGEWVIRYDSESVMAYACIIVAVFFGVLTGYVTVSMPKAGFFALGVWLGVVLALLFNNAFLYKIQIVHQSVVLWVTIGILSLSMGLLSCFYYRYCVIVCTSFIGSYCLIRPFGWILGSFPNELQIAQELKYGTISEVPPLFYLYFALIILIGLIGAKFQYGMYLARRLEEEQKDLQLFLADPDFIDMNKSLLEKDEEDLTEKEKEIKKKVIRMQKNVEKEKQRQDKIMRNAEKYRRRQKGEEDVSDDEEEEEDGDNDQEGSDDDENDDGDRTSRSKKNNRTQESSGFFGMITSKFKGAVAAAGSTRRKSVASASQKSKAKGGAKQKKQQQSDSDEQDSDADEEERSPPKKNQKSKGQQQQKSTKSKTRESPEESEVATKKFSQMFAGMKKQNASKINHEEEDDHGIEMDDLSDAGQQDDRHYYNNNNSNNENNSKYSNNNNNNSVTRTNYENDEEQQQYQPPQQLYQEQQQQQQRHSADSDQEEQELDETELEETKPSKKQQQNGKNKANSANNIAKAAKAAKKGRK